MKKICFLLSFLLLLSCVGCQNQTTTKKARTPDSYLAEAEHYLETGDTETAIKVLEEGIEKTGDESLSAKLAELKPEEAAAPTNCPQCEAELAEGAKFCPECGADTAVKAALTNCPDCDAELKDGTKFCPDCGKDLTAAAEEPSSTEDTLNTQKIAEEFFSYLCISFDAESFLGMMPIDFFADTWAELEGEEAAQSILDAFLSDCQAELDAIEADLEGPRSDYGVTIISEEKYDINELATDYSQIDATLEDAICAECEITFCEASGSVYTTTAELILVKLDGQWYVDPAYWVE